MKTYAHFNLAEDEKDVTDEQISNGGLTGLHLLNRDELIERCKGIARWRTRNGRDGYRYGRFVGVLIGLGISVLAFP